MGTWKRICRWLLYGRMGWAADVSEPHPDKCIICFAPHTSNWDFVIGELYAGADGIRSQFLIKKEWFVWPIGILMRRLGGIPVHRSRQTRMTDMLAETARRRQHFRLCISPEGTRSLNPEWKLGFYYIALKAGIPILLYGLDYEKRRIVCRRTIVATGDAEGQLREIKQYFKRFTGRHPEKFTTGE